MKDMLKRNKNTKKENIETFFVILYLVMTFGFRMLWKGLNTLCNWLLDGGPVVKVDGRRYKLIPFKILLATLAIAFLVYIFATGENTCSEYEAGKCVATVLQY